MKSNYCKLGEKQVYINILDNNGNLGHNTNIAKYPVNLLIHQTI